MSCGFFLRPAKRIREIEVNALDVVSDRQLAARPDIRVRPYFAVRFIQLGYLIAAEVHQIARGQRKSRCEGRRAGRRGGARRGSQRCFTDARPFRVVHVLVNRLVAAAQTLLGAQLPLGVVPVLVVGIGMR